MATLDGTIKLPAMGQVSKKHVAIIGGIGAAIVGVGYYRKMKAGPTPVAPVGDPSSDGASFDTTPSGTGSYNQYDTGTGGSPAPIQLQNPGIVTNADWKEAALALNLGGIDADIIAGACSKVLGGSPVTQAQAEIFNEVCGEIDYPPQGYPPVRLTTTTPGTPAKPVTPAKPATPSTGSSQNRYTARNQSMYQIEKIAHPKATAAQLNDLALRAIHANNDAGIHRWPSGVPGPLLTQRKINGSVIVL